MKQVNLIINSKKVRTFVYFLLLFFLFLRLLGAFVDPDMWWHIQLGSNILNNNWVNNLTFTCNEYVWINHSWLSDFLINLLNNTIGLRGLSIFFALIFLGGIFFNFLALKKLLSEWNIKRSKFNNLLYFLIFILLLSTFIAIRPQVFTFFFFNLLFYLLIRLYYSKGISYKTLFPIVLLFLIWVNLHGGFVIGIGLIGIFLIDSFLSLTNNAYLSKKEETALQFKKFKYLLALIVIFVLVSLINPFGFNLWIEIFTLVLGSNNAAYISEWRAINIKESFHLFYFLILLGSFILKIINKNRNILQLLLLVILGLLSIFSIRYILPVSGIIITLFFVEAFSILQKIETFFIKDKDLLKIMNLLKAFVIVFIGLIAAMGSYLSVQYFINLNNLTESNPSLIIYPVKAVDYIKEHQEQFKDLKFYNTYIWGGYLEYVLRDHSWFIDGRMPEWNCGGKVKKNLMLDYIEVEDIKESWLKVLREHGIEAVLVQKQSPLSNVLDKTDNWRLVYSDNISVIFIKK